MMKVAIIGAGASGLCCARHLGKYPDYFQIKVLEQSDVVGGTWVYTPSGSREDMNVHSSMYKNMRTNLPKEIMCFPDFSFPSHLPSFPHHCDVLKYLRDYASEYKLNQFIKFGTIVEQVTPVPLAADGGGCGDGANGDGAGDDGGGSGRCHTENDSKKECCSGRRSNVCCPFPMWGRFKDSVKWKVTSRCVKTDLRSTDEYDAVLVCNGHFFDPATPAIPGLQQFSGHVIHSHLYRDPEVYRKQDVLIIGSGQSGKDIVVDLSLHANKIYLCNRGRFITNDSPLPDNVEELPGITEVEKNGNIHFENGQERQVDSIIMATGYFYRYPFLTEESGIEVDGGTRVTPLYKHVFNSLFPSMAFIGINFSYNPFPYSDYQIRWVLSVWAGDGLLPPTEGMIKDEKEWYKNRLSQGLLPHKAGHQLGSIQWDMLDFFAQSVGTAPQAPVMRMLYEEVWKARTANIMTYKNNNYAVLSPDSYKNLT